jgi:hypothetical protein
MSMLPGMFTAEGYRKAAQRATVPSRVELFGLPTQISLASTCHVTSHLFACSLA